MVKRVGTRIGLKMMIKIKEDKVKDRDDDDDQDQEGQDQGQGWRRSWKVDSRWWRWENGMVASSVLHPSSHHTLFTIPYHIYNSHHTLFTITYLQEPPYHTIPPHTIFTILAGATISYKVYHILYHVLYGLVLCSHNIPYILYWRYMDPCIVLLISRRPLLRCPCMRPPRGISAHTLLRCRRGVAFVVG